VNGKRIASALRFPNEAATSYYLFLADPVEFLLSRGVETAFSFSALFKRLTKSILIKY
jgi:hypothetical protein